MPDPHRWQPINTARETAMHQNLPSQRKERKVRESHVPCHVRDKVKLEGKIRLSKQHKCLVHQTCPLK